MTYSWRRDQQAEERARIRADFDRRLQASAGPVVGHDDLGGLFRTIREAAGLSQRELARHSGVPVRTVARIEAEAHSDARWSTVRRVLQGSGCRVQLLGPDGLPALPWVYESGRDEGGRHVPAHLAVQLPFEGAYERRINAFRARPRLPLWTWSLRDRAAGRRRGSSGSTPSASVDRPVEGTAGPPDGPMLGG